MNPGCIKAKITIFKQPCTPSHLSLRCQVSQAAHLRHKQRLLLLLLLTSGVSLPHFTYSFLLDFSHKSLLSAPLWLLILSYNPFLSLVLTMEQSKLEAGLEDWFLLQHRAFLIHPFTFAKLCPEAPAVVSPWDSFCCHHISLQDHSSLHTLFLCLLFFLLLVWSHVAHDPLLFRSLHHTVIVYTGTCTHLTQHNTGNCWQDLEQLSCVVSWCWRAQQPCWAQQSG